MPPQPESWTSRRSRTERCSRAGEGEAEGTVKEWAVDAARKRARILKGDLKCIASYG